MQSGHLSDSETGHRASQRGRAPDLTTLRILGVLTSQIKEVNNVSFKRFAAINQESSL